MTNSSSTVEQAVFSVTLKTPVNVVALEQKTDGVSDEGLQTARLLAARATLFNDRYDSCNLFAFFYSRDSVLIGRLTPRGKRSEGGCYYLECLFLSFELFVSAGADPLTLYQQSLNTTRFALYRPGTVLQPFSLEHDADLVNVASLNDVIPNPGLRALSLLAQSVLEETQTFFVSRQRSLTLISSLFSVLPIQARGNMNFAVGLYFRGVPTRVVGATAPRRGTFRLPKFHDFVYCLDLQNISDNEDMYALSNPWGVFLEYVLNAGAADYLCRKIGDAYYDGTAGTVFEIGTGAPPSEAIAALGATLLDDFKRAEKSGNFEGSRPYGIDLRDVVGLEFADEDEEEEEDNPFEQSDAWSEIERSRDGEEWKSGDQNRDEFDDIAEIFSDTNVNDDAQNSIQVVRVDDDEYDLFREKDATSCDFNSSDLKKASNGLEEELFGGETFEEQLNRLGETRGKKRPFSSTSDDDETSLDDGKSFDAYADDDDGLIVLSPFAVLSAEFPEKNELLRRFDELVKGVCKLEPDFQSELGRLWREMVENCDFIFIQSVREEYLRYLRRLLNRSSDVEETHPDGELTVGAVDVLEIICSDGDDER